MSRAQKFLVVAILALLAGLGLRLAQPLFHSAGSDPLARADFTLQGGDGRVALADLRGRVVLVNFGYTYCPDVCPTVLANIAAGLKRLTPAELQQVTVVFISVDPGRDTPSRLKEYAGFFHPAILGATGSAAEVADVAGRYGAIYALQKPDDSGNYVVDHSSEIFVVDRGGRISAKVAADLAPERLAAEIRQRF